MEPALGRRLWQLAAIALVLLAAVAVWGEPWLRDYAAFVAVTAAAVLAYRPAG
jgi:hypothetical protein